MPRLDPTDAARRCWKEGVNGERTHQACEQSGRLLCKEALPVQVLEEPVAAPELQLGQVVPRGGGRRLHDQQVLAAGAQAAQQGPQDTHTATAATLLSRPCEEEPAQKKLWRQVCSHRSLPNCCIYLAS